MPKKACSNLLLDSPTLGKRNNKQHYEWWVDKVLCVEVTCETDVIVQSTWKSVSMLWSISAINTLFRCAASLHLPQHGFFFSFVIFGLVWSIRVSLREDIGGNLLSFLVVFFLKCCRFLIFVSSFLEKVVSMWDLSIDWSVYLCPTLVTSCLIGVYGI